jgi:hypothetical protein
VADPARGHAEAGLGTAGFGFGTVILLCWFRISAPTLVAFGLTAGQRFAIRIGPKFCDQDRSKIWPNSGQPEPRLDQMHRTGKRAAACEGSIGDRKFLYVIMGLNKL